jgi:hypothetical protein
MDLEFKNRPWSEYKYFLQQLVSNDHVCRIRSSSTENIDQKEVFLESVFTDSFEICNDLIFTIFENVDKNIKDKVFDCFEINFKYTYLSYKLTILENEDQIYFEKNILIFNPDAFIDSICHKYLNKIINLFLLGEQTKVVYNIINKGISSLKRINLNYGYKNSNKYFTVRNTWIELLSIIKNEIDGNLLIGNHDILERKFQLDSHNESSFFSFKRTEIFLPHPVSQSINDTKLFIEYYLKKKSIDLNIPWLTHLLKLKPLDPTRNQTLIGYYPTLASFYYSAINSNIINQSTIPQVFIKYLSIEYSNILSYDDPLQDVYQTNGKKIKDKYKIFEDIGIEFEKYL